jgi:hypothetical protein
VAWLDGVELATGTLEVDVRGKDVLQQSFLGLAFAGVNDSTFEAVYLRPFNFRAREPNRISWSPASETDRGATWVTGAGGRAASERSSVPSTSVSPCSAPPRGRREAHILESMLLRTVRWLYAAFLAFSLLYFPAKAGFQLRAPVCEYQLDAPLALYSLSNHAHIVLFAIFFLLTCIQFGRVGPAAIGWASLATLGMGIFVEAAEGASGHGHCRLRDLVPDSAGIGIGIALALLWMLAHARLRASRRGAARGR